MRSGVVLAATFLLTTEVLAAGSMSMSHYDVAATVDATRSSLSAVVTITVPVSDVQPETAFILGGTYLISSADAGPGAAVEVAPTDKPFPGLQKITVRPKGPNRGDLQLRMRYAGLLAPSGEPPLNLITPDLVELNLDSLWIPVRNGFTTKFTVSAEIRGVPANLVVVAPGTVRRLGERLLIRRDTGDIDLAFVAMRGLHRKSADGFEFYAADVSAELSSVYRYHGPAAMKFLESWFGRMPHRPARVVMVRRPRMSGYARPGYVVVTEAGAVAGSGSAKFIAHELAHAWWSSGDPTTEHRWLSESIAEYVALRYVEAAFGVNARDEMLARMRPEVAKAGPMLGAGARSDAELYNKGPLLLFELEGRIGRGRLDRLMADLAHQPCRVSSEFFQTLASIAGEEHARDFEKAMRQ
jgi:hypothetical protein